MINKLLVNAEKYSKDNNFKYSYFIRYRPDWTCNKFNISMNDINPKFVYTEIKRNIIGADYLFVLSNKLYREWWKTTIDSKLNREKKPKMNFLKMF